MRLSALAFLFCLISSIANAQITELSKPVICMPVQQLITELEKTYSETAVLVGKQSLIENAVTVVYANPMAGTYTVVEMNQTTGCIISIGTGLQFRLPKNGISL